MSKHLFVITVERNVLGGNGSIRTDVRDVEGKYAQHPLDLMVEADREHGTLSWDLSYDGYALGHSRSNTVRVAVTTENATPQQVMDATVMASRLLA